MQNARDLQLVALDRQRCGEKRANPSPAHGEEQDREERMMGVRMYSLFTSIIHQDDKLGKGAFQLLANDDVVGTIPPWLPRFGRAQGPTAPTNVRLAKSSKRTPWEITCYPCDKVPSESEQRILARRDKEAPRMRGLWQKTRRCQRSWSATISTSTDWCPHA